MTAAHAHAVSEIVDGYTDPADGSFILRFNRPEGGATDYVRFAREDVAVLADIAALEVRRQISTFDAFREGAVATSFDLAEVVGGDALIVIFCRGHGSPAEIVLPKSLATRLMLSIQKLLPMIGGAAHIN